MPNKQTICLIGCAQGVGGAQTSLRQLSKFLVSEGFEVRVFAMTDDPKVSFPGAAAVFRLPLTRQFPWTLVKLFRAWLASRTCRAINPDVFIAVGLSGVANYIARRSSNKTFKICQDFIFSRSHDDPALVKAAAVFDAIAPQTPAMQAAMNQQGFDATPMRWLPCFPETPCGGIMTTLGETNQIHLGYFGRIAPHKGLDLLIAAIASSEELRDISLDIWGSGDTGALVAQVHRADLSDQIRFCGAYPAGRSGAELMANYHALVLPTTGKEGLPLILLEAMSYGLPVLTTRVAAIPDCCDNNPDCVMVEPSVDGLTKGLYDLKGKLRSNFFSPPRQQDFYDRRFSHRAMAQRWRECLVDPERFFSQ